MNTDRGPPPTTDSSSDPNDSVDQNPVGGPLARLGKKLFGGSFETLTAFSDAQRMERLRECEGLELALSDCHRVRERMLQAQRAGESVNAAYAEAAADERLTSIRDTREGMKISRLFGWSEPTARESLPKMPWKGDNEPDRETQSVHTTPPGNGTEDSTSMSFGTGKNGNEGAEVQPRAVQIPTCARESHAAWACRGLAVGCGDRIAILRDCFRRGEEEAAATIKEMTGGDINSWDGDASKLPRVSCVDEQKYLSACVLQREAEMEKRVRERGTKA
eukprot:CAMPEP_0183293098 /NCGR_PEP_ID=MMETSP0160_2-20130417/1920_1 /TAXON_ID=2839 ORGANISM="Odontella Sinensis, Strain Grunow 1884" /NCGR_SAMPLE_ID=MMETSP0160_2 /ASSEMBLY_ACC=CAM_ASM_000250 /LENGTH=275 /DNA_ID=CAMNT_0025454159 /DNA_START=13 /DNA_END=840 /DNA_ORIENTATION=+